MKRLTVKPGGAGAPVPTLSLKDAVAITVGIVVGAGIFRTPSFVAANAGGEGEVLLVWLAGGLVSLVGALCYAELATSYPHPGGDYHFLTRAYGRPLAFLYAWSRIAVVQTGSVALLAFVFGDYASQLLDLGPHSAALYAALVVVALTALNVLGVRQGSRTQNWLTAVEVLSLVLVIVAGLLLASKGAGASAPTPAATTPGAGGPQVSLGLALVFVLLTYGGWNEAAYVSSEVRGPRRNVARALLLSIGVITALYMLVNFAYLRGLGLGGVAGSEAVAADLMRRAWGENGARFVSVLVAVSALTSANATIITGARTNYALGRDFRLFDFLGRWHERANTPTNALLVQGAIALALVLAGTLAREGFATMVEYTAPVFWFFFLLTGFALIVLRVREPGVERPFRVPLYPLTPLLFCAACVYMLRASVAYTGAGALAGVAVLLLGLPVLLLARPREPAPVVKYTEESA
ncbi:MAG TPA: amino acid permease [Pyrinomonadaceae bacterium]|nr:amino acid permease [Pyrinomonadaceae bacterium]